MGFLKTIEKIIADGKLLALIVRRSFQQPGCSFFTPEDFPFQLGMHIRAAQTHIDAHEHKPFAELKNIPAQEFFYVKKGKVEVGIYHREKPYKKLVLGAGDMIVLNCAHDVTFLEDTEMVELKQGPYRGKEKEKTYL